jgi:hypothetical protein
MKIQHSDSAFFPYYQALALPQLLWEERVREQNKKDRRSLASPSHETQSSRDDSVLELTPELKSLKAELESLVSSYAPRIWWHPDDPFGPMDPLEFIENSSLWFRTPLGGDQKVTQKGAILPEELGSRSTGQYAQEKHENHLITPAHANPVSHPHESGSRAGFFMKYKGPLQDDERVKGRDRADAWREVPMLWKLGLLPPESFQSRLGDKNSQILLLEYWYHLAYSTPNLFGVGDHEGDWEGLAFLIEVEQLSGGKLQHKPIASFLAAHESGTWHCATDLQWIEEHGRRQPEVFTALGSHATYPAEGQFRNLFFPDRTKRGIAWDTWHHLRPLEQEPYYGYTGAWGRLGPLSFMSGPRAPDLTKTLPGLHLQRRLPANLIDSCQ